eukprot:4318064-Pleurochrysis_carterae.AAC.1
MKTAKKQVAATLRRMARHWQLDSTPFALWLLARTTALALGVGLLSGRETTRHDQRRGFDERGKAGRACYFKLATHI